MKLEDIEKVIPWTEMNHGGSMENVNPNPLNDDVVGVGVGDDGFYAVMTNGDKRPMLWPGTEQTVEEKAFWTRVKNQAAFIYSYKRAVTDDEKNRLWCDLSRDQRRTIKKFVEDIDALNAKGTFSNG